jgi:hypothetical protein
MSWKFGIAEVVFSFRDRRFSGLIAQNCSAFVDANSSKLPKSPDFAGGSKSSSGLPVIGSSGSPKLLERSSFSRVVYL